MPSGASHDRITYITAPLITVGSFFVTRNNPDLLIPVLSTSSYIFAGLMFGPDLDIKSKQTKRWGWFKFIWTPYQKAFRHRSVFTHGILIGTIVRLLYLAAVLFPLIVMFRLYAPSQYLTVYRVFYNLSSLQLISIFVGLELGAASHYVADAITSKTNKYLKARR